MAVDVKLVKPFISATKKVLGNFELTGIKTGKVLKKESLKSNYPITVLVGLTGDVQGNVTYNMDEETALDMAGAMMMGMEVNELDEMAKSAISELSNMISGNAVSILEEMKKVLNISPPTLITGKNIVSWISQVETVMIELETPVGKIELNVGLEM